MKKELKNEELTEQEVPEQAAEESPEHEVLDSEFESEIFVEDEPIDFEIEELPDEVFEEPDDMAAEELLIEEIEEPEVVVAEELLIEEPEVVVAEELPVEQIAEPEAAPAIAEAEPKPVAEKTEPVQKRSNKRILQGKVVSNKAQKTVLVKIERQVAHPLYKKYYKRSKKIMAHDENNECGIGDLVRVRECRPLSKMKRWELLEIIERAK